MLTDHEGPQHDGGKTVYPRLTHDLDFSALLAATSDVAPSVVQLRMQDLLSERAVEAT
jgi:predicted nuclease of predicted toxin-antitoxin system